MSRKAMVLLAGMAGILVCGTAAAFYLYPSYLSINVSQIQQHPYDYEGIGWITLRGCTEGETYKAKVYQWDTSGYLTALDLTYGGVHYTSSLNPTANLGMPVYDEEYDDHVISGIPVMLYQSANNNTSVQLIFWEDLENGTNDVHDPGEPYMTYAIFGY